MATAWSWQTDEDEMRLVLTGELDLDASGGLTDDVAKVAGSGDAQIVVDTAGVTFVDSSGLRALLEIAATPGDRVRFDEFSPAVERLVELTGTGQLLRH
jgi:anti-anti-sigma factor